MGLFSSLFGSKPQYPQLDPNSAPAKRVMEVAPQLNELARSVSQRLEIVPSEHAAYVFIGKPPGNFGLAWIHDGALEGLNTLIQEHGIKASEVEGVMRELRAAYEHHMEDARFEMDIAKRSFVVTPSETFEAEVHEIIDRIATH